MGAKALIAGIPGGARKTATTSGDAAPATTPGFMGALLTRAATAAAARVPGPTLVGGRPGGGKRKTTLGAPAEPREGITGAPRAPRIGTTIGGGY